MDHDVWGALALFLIAISMIAPSQLDKLRRKNQAASTIQPDTFFDKITEYRNDVVRPA